MKKSTSKSKAQLRKIRKRKQIINAIAELTTVGIIMLGFPFIMFLLG